MASVTCPVPEPLHTSDARIALDKVKRDMPALSPAAQRREAARVAGTTHEAFNSAIG